MCSAGTDASSAACSFFAPGAVALTPAQRSTAYFFLAIFWVSTSFLAAGIFLTPMIAGGREPRGQHVLATELGRFHQGLSLTLAVLAGLIVAVAVRQRLAVTNH